MSHIGRLFKKSVSEFKQEPKKLGKFTIEPQHGANVFIYNVYRDFEIPTRKIKQHIYTIEITSNIICVNLGKTYYTTYKKDYQNLIKEIENIYPSFKIKVIQ